MLGRMKMSVDGALEVYERFGSQVFGNPRTMHIRSILWRPRSKYNHRTFLGVLRNVVAENVPRAQDGQANDFYPQPNPNDCKTYEIVFIPLYICHSWLLSRVVVAIQVGNAANKPFLFRTYDHEVLPNAVPGRSSRVRNPGRAYNAKICEIARATTAAPVFFSSMIING